MTALNIIPIDEEIVLNDNEIIVSKTNLKGEITYANDVFCRVAEMELDDVINQPHNIIRHPDMPRSIFHLLWQQIKNKKEIFAYVKNMTKSGKYYWVYAHVTPTIDSMGEVSGYHSSRRKPEAQKVAAISDIYKVLLDIEEKPENRKDGLIAATAFLEDLLAKEGVSYDEFIWSVGE